MDMKQLAANRPAKPRSTMDKLKTVHKHVKNWHQLIWDKLFAGDNLIYQFRNGLSIECRRKSTDINEAIVVLSGIEYPQELCTLSRENAVVFDVGANIGTFGVFLHSLNGNRDYRLYAFEPFEGNLDLAKKNFERNGLKNYHLLPQAVSGKNGKVQFDVSGAFDAHKINHNLSGGIEVESVTLSHFCRQNNIAFIDVLKMDIEGSEFEILAADGDFICQNVGVLLMEYHLSESHPNIDAVLAQLSPHFDVLTENTHAGGGMLLAVKKQRG